MTSKRGRYEVLSRLPGCISDTVSCLKLFSRICKRKRKENAESGEKTSPPTQKQEGKLCQSIHYVLPDWPSVYRNRAFWTSLVKGGFRYKHYPYKGDGSFNEADSYYCVPDSKVNKLVSFMEEADGGSVLVSGYRGTGKTSLVENALHQVLEERDSSYVKSEGYSKWMFSLHRIVLIMPLVMVVLLLAYVVEDGSGMVSRMLAITKCLPFGGVILMAVASLAFLVGEITKKWLEKQDKKKSQSCEEEEKDDKTQEGKRGEKLIEIFQKIGKWLGKLILWIVLFLIPLFCLQKALYSNSKLLEWLNWIPLDKDGYKVLFYIYLSLFALIVPIYAVFREITLMTPRQGAERGALVVRINLSTSRTTQAVLSEMLRKLADSVKKQDKGRRFGVSKLRCTRHNGKMPYVALRRGIKKRILKAFDNCVVSSRERHSSRVLGMELPLWGKDSGGNAELKSSETRVYLKSSEHEAQADLIDCLRDLDMFGIKVIFLLDEMDKLAPEQELQTRRDYQEKLRELQKVVSDLKHLLTETYAHYVFVAGKQTDDSWLEDQNKGEGLLESAFSMNIYLPSLFQLRLRATAGPHDRWIRKLYNKAYKDASPPSSADKIRYERWVQDFYGLLLGQLDIRPHSWTYNTALLILPYFSKYELGKILSRYQYRKEESKVQEALGVSLDEVLKECFDYKKATELYKQDNPPIYKITLSIRQIRRLRVLMEYLTYKGRGIPRKVLRGFYGFVEGRNYLVDPSTGKHLYSDEDWKRKRDDPKYIAAMDYLTQQKMTFFADIVAFIEERLSLFRNVDDKGCVATFHVIDYILKFYETGFVLRDVEHANFMTKRQEYFPSRGLVESVIGMVEGFLIQRKDRRSSQYRLVPQVAEDLGKLFLSFGPEQIELRYTLTEYRDEIDMLKKAIKQAEKLDPGTRIESVAVQLRLGRIYEDLGSLLEARMAYLKALRWVRHDLIQLEQVKRDGIGLPEVQVRYYLTTLVGIQHRLGHLEGMLGEYRSSLGYYEQAIRYHEKYVQNVLKQQGEERGTRDWNDKDKKPYLKLWQRMLPESDWDNTIVQVVKAGSSELRMFDRIKGTLRPLNTKEEPDHYVESLNYAALCLDKMNDRLAANHYLLKGLDYYHAINDEQGMIDQLILIGEIHVRRRYLRRAYRAYKLALIQSLRMKWVDPEDHVSATTDYHLAAIARLCMYIGDILHATSGQVVLTVDEISNIDENNKEEEGKEKERSKRIRKKVYFLISQISQEGAAGYLVFQKEIFSGEQDEIKLYELYDYFYGVASRLYSSIGMEYQERESYLRQVVVRARRFTSKLNAATKSKSPLSSGDAICAWNFFWSAANREQKRILETRHAGRKSTGNVWGRIVDRRAMGLLLYTAGNFLRRYTAVDDIPPFLEVNDFLGESQRRLEKLYIREYIKRFNEERKVGHESGDIIEDKIKEFSKPDNSKKAIASFFSFLLDIREEYLEENKNLSLLDKLRLNKDAVYSLLWQSEKHHEDGDNDKGIIRGGLIDKAIKDLNISREESIYSILRCLALAEYALLGSSVVLRDCNRNRDTAHAALSLGKLYLQGFILLLKKWKSGTNLDDYAKLFCHFYAASKRFLAKAIDILTIEREKARTLLPLLGDAHSYMTDLLVLYYSLILDRNIEGFWVVKIKEMEDIQKGFSEKIKDEMKLWDEKGEIHDLSLEQIRTQIKDNLKEAIKSYQLELQEYLSGYRMPGTVHYAHRNIINDKEHFAICEQIHKRFRASPSFRKRHLEKLSDMRRMMAECEAKSLDPFTDKERWDKDFKKVYSLTHYLRLGGSDFFIEGLDKPEKKFRYYMSEHMKENESTQQE